MKPERHGYIHTNKQNIIAYKGDSVCKSVFLTIILSVFFLVEIIMARKMSSFVPQRKRRRKESFDDGPERKRRRTERFNEGLERKRRRMEKKRRRTESFDEGQERKEKRECSFEKLPSLNFVSPALIGNKVDSTVEGELQL